MSPITNTFSFFHPKQNFAHKLSVKFFWGFLKKRLFDTLEQIRKAHAGLPGLAKSAHFAF